MMNELGIQDLVEMKPRVPLVEARRIMLESDMLWTTLGTGKESASFIPSKLMEYMAAGKPILGFFPDGEAASLIRKTGTGIVFLNDDPGPIIQFLCDAMIDKQSALSRCFNPVAEEIDVYRMDRIVSGFNSLLESLVH